MQFLHIQTNMLRLIGYPIDNRGSAPWNAYANVCWILLAIITIPEIHFVVENISDIPMATDALCTLLTCFLSLSKLLTMQFKRTQFYQMIDVLHSLWKNTPDKDRKHLLVAYEMVKRLSVFYIASSFSVGLLFMSIPLGKSGYEKLTTGNTTWTMPMRSVFIYDISKHPNYELTFLWFVQSTLTTAAGATAIDSIFYAAAFNLSAHFRIIQFRIQRIVFEEKNNSGEIILSREFRRIIQYHTRIIELATRLTDIYRPILFTQFMISSVQICVIAYQITLVSSDRMLDFILYALFLVAILFQCLVYCHGGTQLGAESIAVADATYGSLWYTTQCSTQKSIRFVLKRSQKPIIVSAGFFNANLESFKAIISTAGSYITLLQTMSNN